MKEVAPSQTLVIITLIQDNTTDGQLSSVIVNGYGSAEIAAALDTSIETVAKTRQQLVEEGFASALTRKHSSASARLRIFDGAAEDHADV